MTFSDPITRSINELVSQLPKRSQTITGPARFATRKVTKSRSLVINAAFRMIASSQIAPSVAVASPISKNMDRFVTEFVQAGGQTRGQLRIDQKAQVLLRSDDRMIGVVSREGERNVNVSTLQIGIIAQNCLAAHARGKHSKNVTDGDPQIANAGASMHPLGMHGNTPEEFGRARHAFDLHQTS
jgi:hypothetical protein